MGAWVHAWVSVSYCSAGYMVSLAGSLWLCVCVSPPLRLAWVSVSECSAGYMVSAPLSSSSFPRGACDRECVLVRQTCVCVCVSMYSTDV